uniref:Glutathione S-transferase A2-like n=1 Tax=Saccoglossus kowalevskii TaxID=10224 RepID=A0ABM0M1A1_SACKO|nr:PREDICTED: glutathione S-transferase A2-like [Saccoglossus kowalevskii]
MKKESVAGDLLFMQVPMLEIDGMKLVQTNAIIRYIARKYDMYGKTLEQKTRIDVLYDGARDFIMKFLNIGWNKSMEEDSKDVKENAVPRYLPVLEKELCGTSSGYLVGDDLSMADLAVLESLLYCDDYFPAVLEDYPKLKEFKDRLSSLPRIRAFLNGPQRKRKLTEEDILHGKKVLAWLYQ